MRTRLLAAVLSLTAFLPLSAEVCNLKVVTDASPDYSGLPSLVHSVTSKWPTPKEKCWAMFYWNHKARRQTAPMERHGRALTDPIRQFNDYGYTMCSTISGINCAIWNAMGLKAKYWDISNHTVAEVFYDGRWQSYYYDWDGGHRFILNSRPGEDYFRWCRHGGEDARYYVPNHGKDPDPRYGLRGNGRWSCRPSLEAVEVCTSLDGQAWTPQGFLQTAWWMREVPMNFMIPDDELVQGATFRLVPEKPVQARYVKYQVTNKRIFCCTELEVLDAIRHEPFDLRISLPDEP